MTPPTLSSTDFELVRTLLRTHAGIALEPGKEYLVEARLTALAQQLGTTFAQLLAELRGHPSPRIRQSVAQAMAIHETSFFRDFRPFEALRQTILPDLLRAREKQRRLTIWSAACSTGQEPYSLAMLLREHFPALSDWTVTILATDLSIDVISRAEQGRYSQLETNRGLPAPLLVRYFQRAGVSWELRPDLRRMVTFRQLNLAGPWPEVPPVELVFMRNVLIYFGESERANILRRVHERLAPGGYLLMGTGETPRGACDEFVSRENLGGSFFMKRVNQ